MINDLIQLKLSFFYLEEERERERVEKKHDLKLICLGQDSNANYSINKNK